MTSEKKQITIQAEDLTVGYFRKKENIIISDTINFSFSQGELIGLVGANGIGKSTLLRTLAGMQDKLSGKIYINEKLQDQYSTLQLANEVSVVLTEPPASKNLSVLELISLGRQPYTSWMGTLSEKDKVAVNNALQATETQELAHRKCFELSDGQLQRVAIARALAQDTPIIILDEPTTHLDLYHRAYILKLLKKLVSESNKTVLFSTHEIDLAIQLSDKMMVMT
ncbi:MAG TPA: ABC transporter ATP-binding protein, partial [Flavobacteriaceae bacterium]|nr:ABC transporter ATP-binding protein [Flavobacteriaceae bacterium]